MPAFRERLASSISSNGSLLCLGLDPDGVDSADAALSVCLTLLEAVAGEISAVKANIAFFERFGSAGYAALEQLRGHVPPELIYLVDAKRGDIGNTARAYAIALFDVLGADAVTVNPLMGRDCVEPFITEGRGVFLLGRTSNPGAQDLLLQPMANGDRLCDRIIDSGIRWDLGRGAIGFVVGATDAEAVREARRRAGDAPLLIPGIGAQGGDLAAAVSAALDSDGGGVLVPLSRGISTAPEGPAVAAQQLRRRIEAIRHDRVSSGSP